MTTPPVSDDVLRATAEVYKRHNGNTSRAAAEIGMARSTVQARIRTWKERSGTTSESAVTPPDLPDPELTAEQILDFRCKRFRQKADAHAARQWMPFKVNLPGPFGLAFVGDPHLDDDGCNIPLLRQDMDLIQRTDGLWSVGMGDYTNNWAGRLQRIYGEQETTIPQAWRLAEWFFGLKKPDGSSVHWLLIKGNHDLWSGPTDPLDWMQRGAAALEDWRATIKIVCKNGREILADIAHNHPGHSIYNPGHGPMRKAMFTGAQADIYVAGDKHNWFCAELEDQQDMGRVYWALRCRGYKYFDDYAARLGYGDQQFGATITAIIDPDKDGPQAVRCFPHIQEAAEFLTWKRSR